MSDIILTVDYEFETDLSSAVSKLINSINADVPKIKIEFDYKSSVEKLKKEMSSSFGNVNFGGSTNAKSAIPNNFVSGVTQSAKAASSQLGELTKSVATYNNNAAKASSATQTYTNSLTGTTTTVRQLADTQGNLVTVSKTVSESFDTQASKAKQAASASKQLASEASKVEKLYTSLNSSNGKESDEYKLVEKYEAELKAIGTKYGVLSVDESGAPSFELPSSLTGDYKEFSVELTNLQTKYIALKQVVDSFNASASGGSTAKQAASASKQLASEASKVEKLFASLGYSENVQKTNEYSLIEKYESELKALGKKYGLLSFDEDGAVNQLLPESLTGSYEEFSTELTKLQTKYISLKSVVDDFNKSAKAGVTETSAEMSAKNKYFSILNSGTSALKYTAAKNSSNITSQAAYTEIENQVNNIKSLYSQFDSKSIGLNEFVTQLTQAESKILENISTIKANGDAYESLGDRINNAAEKYGVFLNTSMVIMQAIQTVKQMVSTVIELDTAMTELKKVTDETDATYNRFLSNASTRATSMGATISDTVTATADFARLGYSLSESESLADAAIVYKNVGDGIESISDASDSIISTMQAFGIEANNAMSIVDKFNEVGNNYAISSDGIGEAMLKSASSLNAAGNTLDESIALITAANTVVQNPETVGTTMKTVSMYLRAAKTDAEAAGLETDGMASSVSKLRDEILTLTKNKVDIQIDDTTFKSTYEILKEIAAVWDDLTDVDQANLTEIMGGKRNGNVISALMENFDVAEDVLKTSSEDYVDSATNENEKYLDSIEGRISILKANFESLSSTIVDTDLVKFFVDSGTSALQLINSVAKLVDSFGGLKTVMLAIGGTVISKNFSSLSSIFSSLISTITKLPTKALGAFTTSISDFKTAVNMVRSGEASVSEAFSMVGSSITGWATAIVTTAVAAYSAWRNSVEQTRADIIDTAEESANEADNVMDLYSAYQDASSAYASNSGSKSELTSATTALLSALGVEESEIEELATKYGSLDTAINSVTADSLNKAADDALSGYKAAYDNLQDNFGNGGDIVQNLFNDKGGVFWTESDIGLGSKVLDLLQDYSPDLQYENNNRVDIALADDSVSDVLASYDQLLAMRNKLKDGLTTQEYSDSEAAASIESKISEYEDVLEEYNNAKVLLNTTQAKSDIFSKMSKNGIPETTKEYKKLHQEILDTALASGEFVGSDEDIAEAVDTAFEELAEDIPSLSSAMETLSATSSNVSENYQKAADAISRTVDEAGEAATTLTSGLDDVWEVLGDQQSGKSISYADFSSDSLKDYQSALELTNGTMQLNAEKVREIAKAKVEEEVATNNTNKALEQAKYIENAKQIESLRQTLKNAQASASGASAASVDAINSQINALLEENSTIADTCKQYDLLSASMQEAVGAYQNWLNAESASDYGDMEDDTVDALQRIQDAYDEDSDTYGYFGSKKFTAAAEFIIPDNIDREDTDAIKSYMDSISSYLNRDSDGVIKGLNVDHFLDEAVENGLMTLEDDVYSIIDGIKAEDFAEKLGLSDGVVQAMFDQLSLQGAHFDWSDELTKTLGDMAIEANEAAESLKGIDEYSDLDIKLNVSDIEDTDEKISALDDTIAQMNDIKANVDVDSSEAEYANDIIQYCIMQKQSLSEPTIMKVDTSQVEGDMGTAISLLQQFQEAQNAYEIAIAIGADTSGVEKTISDLTTQISNIDPDIQARLSLDSTSTDSIKESIASIDLETLTTEAGVDSTAVDEYQPDDKRCKVNYEPNTSALPESFADITRYVNYIQRPISSGKNSLNGTAHVSGTAKASGDWGTASGGSTLVGELGREIVVDPHTGRWYTVGDTGAEFVDIPRGSIVFNHLQTEDLLENGYVSGRASALVSGTALVSGSYKRHKNANSSSNYSGSSSSSSSSSSDYSGNYSSSSNDSSSDDDDDSEVIDWIEIAIDRIENAIDKLSTIAESAYHTLSERLTASSEEIDKLISEEHLQSQAYDRYVEEANKVELSDDLKEKVRNGTVDIVEYDSDTADKIEEYQKWWEKALESEKAIVEKRESIAQEYANRFDTVQTNYENKLALKEHKTNTYNNGIDDLETRGYLASTKYYSALSSTEKQNGKILNQELSALRQKMSDAVNSGYIKEGSEEWYQMQQQINAVKESIQQSNTKLVEYSNNIRQLKWDRFDYLQEQISNITTESEFLIDLLENSDLYNDNGQLTDTGLATMGLRAQNYNTYMAQADKYAKEIKKLDKEIAKDPYNTDLLERREELLESQQDAIISAEEEKQAIVDLVQDGIDKELEALQDLIDKYEDSLDTAKDLYDYQKKVKDETSEIASLQKQISAYAGDDSEENKATVQKLQVDLEDALDDLEETQYDNYISEQKKLLSNLYDEYETLLNERLDNVDALISDMIDTVNANSSSIAATLSTEADKVGYTITDNEKAIWNNEGGAYAILSKYGDSFLSQNTSLITVINSIAANVKAMIKNSDDSATTTIDNTTEKTAVTKPKTTTTKPKTTTTKTDNKTTALTDAIKKGVATAIWCNPNSGWGNGSDRTKRLTEKFGSDGQSAIQSYLNSNWSRLLNDWYNDGRYDLSKYSYSAFKTGGLADYTGVAWLDGTPSKPEMVLNANDTSNFIALKDAMSRIANGDTSLSDLLSGNAILDTLSKIDSPTSSGSQSIGDITYQVTIPIDHVQDYDDFMNQMRQDGKFEKMIQSMTVDRLSGGSKISKNKYKW